MTISLHIGDLPSNVVFENSVAVDTESMGLNWDRDRLCLIQLSSGDGNAHLVQFLPGAYAAPHLRALLTNPHIVKIFHYARADIATILHHLGIIVTPLYCTKIASVLVRTFTDRHGLKDLSKDLIGVDVSKEQQTSDWGSPSLTPEQMNYAASDVLHLHKLKAKLDTMLIREDRVDLARKMMDFLATRAELDVKGWKDIDVFSHRPVRRPD